MNGLVIRSFSSVKVKVLLRELHIGHHPRFFMGAQGGKYSNFYRANMPLLKMVRAEFGSGLIYLRVQTNTKLFYANAAGRMLWRSNMLRFAYADSSSACKLAQDMVPTAHTHIEVRAQPLMRVRGCVRGCVRGASACVSSRWKVLSGEFRRRPTELAIERRTTGSCRSPRTV